MRISTGYAKPDCVFKDALQVDISECNFDYLGTWYFGHFSLMT